MFKRFRNFPRDYLRRSTPRQGVIKIKAHAATLAGSALIVPSLCAVYFWNAGTKENEPYWIWASIMVWRIHAGVVAIALLFWLFEKPKLTVYMRDDAIGWAKMARAHPKLALISLAIISLLSAWLAVWEIDIAFSHWRWGRPGSAIGRAWSALPFLIFAVLAGFAPVAVALTQFRKWSRGAFYKAKPR